MTQILKGKVVSNKMQKTIVVEVARLQKHSVYGKFIKISKKYKAHANEPVEIGKTVKIESTSPISKDKKWKLVKLLNSQN